MAKSAKKRLAPFKAKSKKTQSKFEKRMKNNNKVISKLQSK
jgi:hypothetical protein